MSTLDEISEDWQVHGLPPTWAQLHKAQTEYDELRAELQAARQEVMEQAKLNGMGAEREARLMAEVAELKTELERIKALPPVAWAQRTEDDDVGMLFPTRDEAASYSDGLPPISLYALWSKT